jgi:hypothetical protein
MAGLMPHGCRTERTGGISFFLTIDSEKDSRDDFSCATKLPSSGD